MSTAPVTAAAVLAGWVCSALATGDGLRCRAPAGVLAAARFDLRSLADLFDTAGLRTGRTAALSGRPQHRPVVTAISALRAPCEMAGGIPRSRASRTVGCRSLGCTIERLSKA